MAKKGHELDDCNDDPGDTGKLVGPVIGDEFHEALDA